MKNYIFLLLLSAIFVSCQQCQDDKLQFKNRIFAHRMFPFYTKYLKEMDVFFANLTPGNSTELELLFTKNERTKIIGHINVERGYVIFRSQNGYIKFLHTGEVIACPNNKAVEIKFSFRTEKPNLRFTYDSDGMTPGAFMHINGAIPVFKDLESKTPTDYRTQPLKSYLEMGRTVVPLVVELSVDYQGRLSGWCIPFNW